MSKLFLILLILVAISGCESSTKSNLIRPLDEKITEDSCIDLKTFINSQDPKKFQNMCVKSFIIECDAKTGHWIKLNNFGGKAIIAEPEDEKLIFPSNCANKNVLLQCRVINVLNVEDNMHMKNRHNLLGKTWVINNPTVKEKIAIKLIVKSLRLQ